MIRKTYSRWRDRTVFLIDRWRYRNSSVPPLVFVGDSHVNYFRHAAKANAFGRRRIGVCAGAGATAVGLRNPNAKTDALKRFSEYLADWPPETIVVIHLGEVDCGFVIWYRAAKYHDSIERQVNESITAYFGFVDSLAARGYRRVIVTGATLPTIADGQYSGEVANARREVTASLAERTQLTLHYNKRLHEEALARDIPFVDISDDLIDSVTGVVKAEFRNANPLNHHLDHARAAASWAQKLRPVLADYNARASNAS